MVENDPSLCMGDTAAFQALAVDGLICGLPLGRGACITGADLSVTKSDSADPVAPGETFSYTVRVTNGGPESAANVVVTDNLPAGLTLVSTTGCNEDPNGAPTCSLGTMAANTSKTAIIEVTVDTELAPPAQLLNTVTVTSTTKEATPGQETASEQTNVRTATLAKWTFNGGNRGPTTLDPNVTGTTLVSGPGVEFDLGAFFAEPHGFALISRSRNVPGWTTSSTIDLNDYWEVTIEPRPGRMMTVTAFSFDESTDAGPLAFAVRSSLDDFATDLFNGTIPSTGEFDLFRTHSSPLGNEFENLDGPLTFRIYGFNSETRSGSFPNQWIVDDVEISGTSVGLVDLALTKTSADRVVTGESLTYTLTVRNNGTEDAADVVITDNLPAGVTLVSTSGCQEDPAGLPTCTLGTVAGSSTVTVVVETTVGDPGEITNTANVASSSAEGNPGNEEASQTTTIVTPPTADLGLEKTASTAAPVAGGGLSYDLTVTNDGPDDALGITVTDTLPAGLTFVSASNGTADCSETDGTVTCTINELANEASTTITITTTVDVGTIGEVVNQAELQTAGNDANADNDSSEVNVTVFMSGDFNRDGVVDALDVSALVQEINDGDGEAVADVATGTFPGNTDFDLNGDELITTVDIGALAPLALDQMAPANGAAARLTYPQGAGAGSVLDFPRLAVEAGNLTGMAIANPGAQDAALTFRAYGENGALLAEDSNRNVPGGQQLSLLTSELFPGLPAGTVAWFQATSPVSGLSGFFLELNFATFAELDGADLPPRARRIVFNTVQTSDGASTELNVVNPGNATANVTLTLISGEDRVERDIQLPAKGVARMDAATLFGLNDEAPAGANDSSRYILAEANQDLLGFEFIRAADGDLQGLNARSALELLNRIYIPQLAVLGIIESELGLVNYSAQRVIATITAHKTGGDLFGAGEVLTNPVTIALGPGESIRQDVATMFGFQGGDTVQGWLEIESSQAINGFLAYRVPVTGAAAAVSAVAQGTTTAIFSHLATVGDFYTGVAALNPSSYPVNLRIIALSVTGEVLGTFDTVLAPGQRLSDLISNMIPGADDRGGGLILMRTNYPSIFVSLFGTFNGKTFANIPPPVGSSRVYARCGVAPGPGDSALECDSAGSGPAVYGAGHARGGGVEGQWCVGGQYRYGHGDPDGFLHGS